MIKKIPSAGITVIFFLVLVVEGCATVSLDLSTVNSNILMTDRLEKQYAVVNHFNYERKAYFLLLGFIKIANPDFTEVLKEELAKSQGDAIIHTTVEVEYDLVDTIVPYGIGAAGWAVMGPVGLNLSYILTMQTYRIQGDVIRYTP